MKKPLHPSDHDLITQYRAGNRSALRIMVKRYHQLFCHKAYWITRDRETAKDVAQECWMTILTKLDTLAQAERFRSWALRIVYTKAIDRVNLRRKEDQQLATLEPTSSPAEPQEDERELMRQALLTAIQQLPKDKQDIIRLYYAQDYSVTQIGRLLHIPTGTVKSRLYKAREKLKSLLKHLHHER